MTSFSYLHEYEQQRSSYNSYRSMLHLLTNSDSVTLQGRILQTEHVNQGPNDKASPTPFSIPTSTLPMRVGRFARPCAQRNTISGSARSQGLMKFRLTHVGTRVHTDVTRSRVWCAPKIVVAKNFASRHARAPLSPHAVGERRAAFVDAVVEVMCERIDVRRRDIGIGREI